MLSVLNHFRILILPFKFICRDLFIILYLFYSNYLYFFTTDVKEKLQEAIVQEWALTMVPQKTG